MSEIVSIGLNTYLLVLIAFLLIILLFMFRKLIRVLTVAQECREQTASPQKVAFNQGGLKEDCTEEELAAITVALSQILPDNQLNIVNLKLIE